MRFETRELWKTLKLLYQVDRSAFLLGAATSVLESVIYPLMLLLVWRGLRQVLAGTADHGLISWQSAALLGTLFGLLALDAVLRIISDTATSVLQAESAQQVNARIMQKMAEVPYRLFEDNDFQARYGLLISQASYRPGQLVQAFIASISALTASLAVAATLLGFAPILDVFLLVLFPLAMAEARYHGRIVELQTHASPALFRMNYLAQRSIDAAWQRDIRVHRSTILDQEYSFLSSRYLDELRALLHRYQLIRTGVGLGAAAVMTAAVGVVLYRAVGSNPSGVADAVVLLPALLMGLGQGRSFATSWGAMTECLGYLAQLFGFLNHRFDRSDLPRARVKRRAPAAMAS